MGAAGFPNLRATPVIRTGIMMVTCHNGKMDMCLKTLLANSGLVTHGGLPDSIPGLPRVK